MADAVLVDRLRQRIYEECDASAILSAGSSQAAHTIRTLVRGFLVEERVVVPELHAQQIVEQVVAATTGYGPLEPLLSDSSVTEILVNGHTRVFVERAGTLTAVPVRFASEEHVRQVLDRILAPIGRRLDSSMPMVDARLPDGSRVNAVIPPLAVEGTTISIRRFASSIRTLGDLIGAGACSESQVWLLRNLLRDRHNVVVAGGTSSGKTTFLAASLAECDPGDRVVVIEDSAELRIDHPHRVRLESRPPSMDGRGEVRMRELVRNALRMRPDRIVVGEVRGEEAFDLVQAMNTGHRGCWSTVHANSAEDALHRIETMAMTADVGVPHAAIRTQVGRAIDTVVFLTRSSDGSRVLDDIAQVHSTVDGWTIDRL
jgi:pilus assembly protein CpaF